MLDFRVLRIAQRTFEANVRIGSSAADGLADANGRFGAPLVQSRRSVLVKSFGRWQAYESETAEHPFGTLKMRMGATHFLMKRPPKVATEISLHVLAYNLTRVMNIIGVKPLLAAIRA